MTAIRNDSMPLVSVVIATYNMGQYLPLAIRSVLDQRGYPNVEVIVVNDGSGDGTDEIVQALERGDSRIVYLRQANRGQAAAKNAGIAASGGQFIGFLDADDMWLPHKLALQMPLFDRSSGIGVVYSDYETMDGDGRPIPKPATRMYCGKISAQLLVSNCVSFPTAIVKRECFERFGTFDEPLGMGIDYDLWLRLSPHYDFEFVNDCTVRYRIWPGQMSKNYRKRYENGMEIMRRFLERNPGLVSAEQVRTAWANTYVGRGNSILACERDRWAAMCDYARAIRQQPWYFAAWRAMMKVLFGIIPPLA